MNLSRFCELCDESTKGTFFVIDRGDKRQVKLVDSWGLYSCDPRKHLFLAGMEFGPTHLICASNESDAFEAWVDELTPIPADEVPEAYNAFDKLVEFMESKGYPNDRKLREFATRWAPVYFRIATHNANYTGAWDSWELDEAYQYQSNSTDSGIVCLGHYAWLRQASEFEVVVE